MLHKYVSQDQTAELGRVAPEINVYKDVGAPEMNYATISNLVSAPRDSPRDLLLPRTAEPGLRLQ